MRISKSLLLTAITALLTLTCEKVPDFCGTGEVYDPSCEFCFGSRAYPVCSDGSYNPLAGGCDRDNRVGTRCSNDAIVPLNTPCGGYTLRVGAIPAALGKVEIAPDGQTIFSNRDPVTVTAIPEADNEFVGWTGALSSTDRRATYEMKGSKPQVTIVAMFRLRSESGAYTLIATAYPEGAGNISRSREPDIEREKYSHGTTVTLTAEARNGYVFDGWSGSVPSSAQSSKEHRITLTMDETKTVVAMFIPAVYTLNATANPADGGAVFVNGNALSANASREVGTEVQVWARAAEGYVFDRWSGPIATDAAGGKNPAVITVTNGMTITANFKPGSGGGITAPPTSYTLTTTANLLEGGTISRNPNAENYNTGTPVTVTATANAGYEFTGWTGTGTPDSTDPSVTITMTGDKALTANFQKDNGEVPPPPDTTYTVTFNANGGTPAPTSQSVNHGDSINLPQTMTKSGYDFGGWYATATFTAASKVTFPLTITANTALYAQWTETNVTLTMYYAVTFNANGGTVSPTSDTTSANGKLRSLPTPSKNGYVFSGWYTAETGGTPVTVNTVFEKNAIIYAQWAKATPTTHTLKVNRNPTNGGTTNIDSAWTNNSVGMQQSILATAASGYTFSNWTVTGGGSIANANNASTVVTVNGNATVTANFTLSGAVYGPPLSYGGQTYETVVIGNNTWMAKNLNYATPSGSWCYGDEPDNCNRYGRLYDWATAMNISSSFNNGHWDGNDVKHQGVCPAGWHLPSKSEWSALDMASGFVDDDTKLKSTSGWNDNGNGTDVLGFSALPGGYGRAGGSFYGVGDIGFLWTATEYANESAYRRNFSSIYSGGYDNGEKEVGIAVRCTKNNIGGGDVTKETFIDSRDGKMYQMAVIGGKTWMAENLNYHPQSGNSWCNGDNNSNCDIYGRLYDWNTAMAGVAGTTANPSRVKGVCPIGWHLPSRDEWKSLVDYAGGYSTAGTKLKSTSGWYTRYGGDGNGTDAFGFSALPGGYRYGSGGYFNNAGYNGGWWTATEDSYQTMSSEHEDVYYNGNGNKEDGYSVRCVSD